MSIRINQRVRTAAQWTSLNPTLAKNEIAIETDTGRAKRGDGQTAWTSLAYFGKDSAAEIIATLGGPVSVEETAVAAADLYTALETLGLIVDIP